MQPRSRGLGETPRLTAILCTRSVSYTIHWQFRVTNVWCGNNALPILTLTIALHPDPNLGPNPNSPVHGARASPQGLGVRH